MNGILLCAPGANNSQAIVSTTIGLGLPLLARHLIHFAPEEV